ncbi:hypothetical protein MKX01_001245 [Papaver californicum]|nr:hypothetical protein MKX01_001245 [Papaver californicum]
MKLMLDPTKRYYPVKILECSTFVANTEFSTSTNTSFTEFITAINVANQAPPPMLIKGLPSARPIATLAAPPSLHYRDGSSWRSVCNTKETSIFTPGYLGHLSL